MQIDLGTTGVGPPFPNIEQPQVHRVGIHISMARPQKPSVTLGCPGQRCFMVVVSPQKVVGCKGGNQNADGDLLTFG